MSSKNVADVMPEPTFVPPLAGARVPNVSLHVPGLAVEYRNQPVVVAPPGTDDAFRRAVAPVISVALLVLDVGNEAVVVNDKMPPNDVPYPFCAIAQ
jgi:hypothetical protein